MTSTYEARVIETESPTPLAKFPMGFHDGASSYCVAYFEEFRRAVKSVDLIEVERAAAILLHAYRTDALVFSCGNGGSAAIANHLQCDHLKGVRTDTDLTPRVVSLASNVEVLTAVSNDIGYDEVFAYQLQAQGRPGDVLVTISSSGSSENIVQAIRSRVEAGDPDHLPDGVRRGACQGAGRCGDPCRLHELWRRRRSPSGDHAYDGTVRPAVEDDSRRHRDDHLLTGEYRYRRQS